MGTRSQASRSVLRDDLSDIPLRKHNSHRKQTHIFYCFRSSHYSGNPKNPHRSSGCAVPSLHDSGRKVLGRSPIFLNLSQIPHTPSGQSAPASQWRRMRGRLWWLVETVPESHIFRSNQRHPESFHMPPPAMSDQTRECAQILQTCAYPAQSVKRSDPDRLLKQRPCHLSRPHRQAT